MKNMKKASCHNQSIKRFLSPQPSNIPCKKQCKQMDMTNKCTTTRRDKNICLFSLNATKQSSDEMEKRQDLNTNNAVNKFDWNSFVRDPGEIQESRYPVTLNTFKTMTLCLSIVNCILEDIKSATSLDFLNDDLMKERVIKNFYIQFYENPQIRNIYKLETKPCPTFVKKKIMQVPTLENIEAKDSTTNAAKVATANIADGEDVSKPTELRVPVEHALKIAEPIEPLNKPADLERVEAKSTKSQEYEISPQQAKAKSNILYISKNTLFMDETFLRRHVSRNIQQEEKLEKILEQIYAELLPRKKSEVKQKLKPTTVQEIADEVAIDISKSPEDTTALISREQRLEQAKHLYFKDYTKTNTLAYALRFHNGLKRRIISAVLDMSIDEFKKYTKIHDAPELYDDAKLLNDCYNYAIKAPQIWPVNLHMQLSDLYEYLKSRSVTGVSVDNLEDISPMLLHWTELAVITNFDKIMQWDFYRCNGKKFRQFTHMDVFRKKFYEKCWIHNTWLQEVPKLHIDVQKQLETRMVVVEDDIVKEEEEAKKDESTNFMNVDGEHSAEANTNNIIANAAHAQDASAGPLTETNEELLSHNLTEASSVEQAVTVNNVPNTLPEATVNLQTTTTAVVEIITNSNENIVASKRAVDVQQRIQAAQKLYFYKVEKSCTLPYLLRLHNGLKRCILHAILNMTYTEFKQYTHIYDAAEIYENNELLQHCYDFVVKKPQVWPVNLYMRLVDLYKFLKIKGVTLTAADLKHVSPKLLHWHDLIASTNYDYILFWDHYRSRGKKMPKNKPPPNTYRQKFYEKCWINDSWIWHTPKICDNILTDIFGAVAATEDVENANFERAVMTHALEERVTESVSPTEDEAINDATNGPPPVQAIAHENVVLATNNTRSVNTVDAEIQTSQHLLAAFTNSLTVMREPEVTAQNPNPVILPCKAIKKEKLSPLDKLQFNLTNDEKNYECMPVPDDVVDLEGSISANESQEELMLPLLNSESLFTPVNKLFLSLDSTEDKFAQLTENVDNESIREQQPSLELNNQQTQLMPECALEMEIEVQSTEDLHEQTTTTTQQSLTVAVIESNQASFEQPPIETQAKTIKTHSAQQPAETCSLQEQQKQSNIVVQQVLTSEQVNVPAFISREVKQELLQQVQQPTGNCTEQLKQKQQTVKQLKNTAIEVTTALTRILEAHKLAQQQKQQHNRTKSAPATVELQSEQQQNQTLETPAAMEKQQQPSQQKQPLQQQRFSQQQFSQQQQSQKQQPSQQQQPKTTIDQQQIQKHQQEPPTVMIPLSKSQQQQKKHQQQIAVLKPATQKQRVIKAPPTIQQQHESVTIAPQPIQQQQESVTMAPQPIQQQQESVTIVSQSIQKRQQQNTFTTITEISSNHKKRQQYTELQPKQQTSKEQRPTLQQHTSLRQQQQPPLPTVVIPLSALQQQQQQPLSTVVIPLQQQNEAVEKQATQKLRMPVEQQTTQQQPEIIKSQRTPQISQITETQKVTHTQKPLEPKRLVKPIQPSPPLTTRIHVQQQLQQQQQKQEHRQIEKEMNELLQEQQLVPQIVAIAADTQTQPKLQELSPQLTQTAPPNHLVAQQLAINNQNITELAENAQTLMEPIEQNQALQQQIIVESFNASKQAGIEFLSQPTAHQRQLNQPQFILQRTSTQIQEQLMIRPTCTLSQDSPVNLPPMVKLANKQTSNTTKVKTVKSTKATTRKGAKNSDYVPQLTHVFQPLPVALNTKKATTQSIATDSLRQFTTDVATPNNQQPQQLTSAVGEQLSTASNINVSPPNANAMILTLPATMNAASSSASNTSYVYTLSGDSTFFNSSEILKAIENYQLQLSQQQLAQSEQSIQQQACAQMSELVYVQADMAQLQQQQCAEMQQEQQFEHYNQLQVTQQQQQQLQHYPASTQISQPLTFVASAEQQQATQQPQQQQRKLQQLHQQQVPLQMSQPLVMWDRAKQQQQSQQQQAYQLLLQQPQQAQPIVYQLVNVNQAPHTADADAVEQAQQYLQLTAEQRQTSNLTQREVHEASTTQAQQSTTLDTVSEHLPYMSSNEMLQVNVWLEHNYAMTPLSPALLLRSLPSPKGVCRMRTRPPPKPFFYRRLEKIDYFRELTALNIAEYQLQCTSLGKSYLQAKIRTTHLRTVVSGDILAALLPRLPSDVLKHLQLVLQYLGEFHFNTWEQRQQRKLISKCSQRTLHTLCAHILLLFFQYSSSFQSKCLDLAAAGWQLEQRDCLSVDTAGASTQRTDNMLEDLSLAIDPCILTEMAALKRNL
nr:uncharacterized protein LOC106619975 isoform X2 [Bactrocera oleae]